MEGFRRSQIRASVKSGAAAEQNVWTRSANRNNGNNTFIVNASGNVNNNNAQNGYACAPDRTGASRQKGHGIAMAPGETGAGSRDPVPERAEHNRGDAGTAGTCAAIMRPGQPPQLEPGELNGIIGFFALRESAMKCRRGVMWKSSVASYILNLSERTLLLHRDLVRGTFSCGATRAFEVMRPKRREIVSVGFRDRVFQRSLNDNSIYPRMAKGFVLDNAACQTGKGTDFARKRLKEFMRSHYRKHGPNGWVCQIDVAGYYPNMRHDITEAAFARKLPEEVMTMTLDVMRSQYPGDVGYNPGSQMIQIAGISVLDRLDHEAKDRMGIRRYIRYMDDAVAIFATEDEARAALSAFGDMLGSLCFELNPKKSRVYPLRDGIEFLGFDFVLTDTGKAMMFVKSSNVKQMHRHIRSMVSLSKRGRCMKATVDQSYESWRAHAAKGDSHNLIRRADAWYKDLWKEQTMLEIKRAGDPAQMRRLENAEADAYRLGAVIEYVAMEADVDIPIYDEIAAPEEVV